MVTPKCTTAVSLKNCSPSLIKCSWIKCHFFVNWWKAISRVCKQFIPAFNKQRKEGGWGLKWHKHHLVNWFWSWTDELPYTSTCKIEVHFSRCLNSAVECSVDREGWLVVKEKANSLKVNCITSGKTTTAVPWYTAHREDHPLEFIALSIYCTHANTEMLPVSLFYIELYCYGSHDCKLWWPSGDGDHKGGLLVISSPSVNLPGIMGWVNTHRHTNMLNREAQADFPICTSAFDQTTIQPHLLAVITVHTVTKFSRECHT